MVLQDMYLKYKISSESCPDPYVEYGDTNVRTRYTYDAYNRRVEKISDAKTISYFYNKNQVVQEYENNALTNTYLYGTYIDDPIAYIYNNNTYFYVKDSQFSIQAVLDNAANILESYSYTAFGELTIKNENDDIITASIVNNSYTYTGRRYDSESELYYYRNRMYNADLKVFMSKDPKGYVDGLNLYSYVKNNPLKYTDPMGTTAKIYGTTTLEGLKEAHQIVSTYGSDALTLIGGGLQIATGGALVTTVVTAPIGGILIAHGSNNMYEGGSNMISSYNGNTDANHVGTVREAYRFIAKTAGYNEKQGDIAYYGVDTFTSIRAATRKVGEKMVISGATTTFVTIRNYQNTAKTSLVVDVVNNALNINNIDKNLNNE